MLYVFFGNDGTQVRQKAHGFLDEIEGERGDVVYVSPETFEEGTLVDIASASSLFSSREVVLIDSLSLEKEMLEALIASAGLLATSPNIFVIIEDTLIAEHKKILTANATEITEVKKSATKKFNPFLLTDAFLHRDKKSLWILLTEAWRNGLSNEEIIGALFWQIKILRLVERTRTAEETEQKPFVYDKAKRALHKFKKGELDKFSRDIISIYHDGHQGKRDVGLALEQWVLKL